MSPGQSIQCNIWPGAATVATDMDGANDGIALLRHYTPKKRAMSTVSDEEIRVIQNTRRGAPSITQSALRFELEYASYLLVKHQYKYGLMVGQPGNVHTFVYKLLPCV